MTPFRDAGNMTDRQKNYNNRLSRTRVPVENAFGLLKTRWRILKNVQCSLKFIPYIIVACCVLHTICITNGDEIEVEVEGDLPDDIVPEAPFNITAFTIAQATLRGREKRERIVASFRR